MNETTTEYTALIAETDLEDKAVRLAYLFAKAKRKLNHMEIQSGPYAPTYEQVEFTRAAVERIRRWCCKNAIAIHMKYYQPFN